jgi:hypothetical protein
MGEPNCVATIKDWKQLAIDVEAILLMDPNAKIKVKIMTRQTT